jgi:hypothetical protein
MKSLPYVVNDDFLDEVTFNKLCGVILGTTFPWNYNDNIVSKDDGGYFQFVHTFYDDYLARSNLFNLLEPILNKLQPKGLVRVKANTTTRTDQHIIHKQHTDLPYSFANAYTSVFYLNTNNGGTVFGEGDFVNSLKNRLITFPVHEKHSGQTCTDENRRVVINLNYFK